MGNHTSAAPVEAGDGDGSMAALRPVDLGLSDLPRRGRPRTSRRARRGSVLPYRPVGPVGQDGGASAPWISAAHASDRLVIASTRARLPPAPRAERAAPPRAGRTERAPPPAPRAPRAERGARSA